MLKIRLFSFLNKSLPKANPIKILTPDLATLLERVRLPFKILECESNILILLRWIL